MENAKIKLKFNNFVNIISVSFVLMTIFNFNGYEIFFSVYIGSILVFLVLFNYKKVLNSVGSLIEHNKLIFAAYTIGVLSTLIAFLRSTIEFKSFLAVIVYGLCNLFGIVVYFVFSKDYITRGMKQILIVLVINGILGILEYITHKNLCVTLGLFSDIYIRNISRIAGMFVHPIINGMMNLCGIIIALFTLQSKIKYLIITLFGVNILLTQSRSSWVALLFIIILMFFRRVLKDKLNTNRLIGFIGILFVLIVVFIFFPDIPNLFISIVTQRFSDFSWYFTSSYQRTGAFLYVIERVFSGNILEMFFGHGNSSSKYIMMQVSIMIKNFDTTDNGYVRDLYNYGVFYVAVIFITMVRIIKSIFSDNDKLSLMFKILVITLEITFFFLEPFGHYPVTYLFFISFGFVCAYFSRKKRQ